MTDIQKEYFCLISQEETESGTFLEYEGSKEGLLAAGVPAQATRLRRSNREYYSFPGCSALRKQDCETSEANARSHFGRSPQVC